MWLSQTVIRYEQAPALAFRVPSCLTLPWPQAQLSLPRSAAALDCRFGLGLQPLAHCPSLSGPVALPPGLSPASSGCLCPAARVRALEDQIPRLQMSAQSASGQAQRALPTRLGEGTLVQRVDVLEDAVDLLLRAQVWGC